MNYTIDLALDNEKKTGVTQQNDKNQKIAPRNLSWRPELDAKESPATIMDASLAGAGMTWTADETEELLGTIRLRWVAQLLGMEKLVLKSGKLIAAFVSDEDSAYFQSATFARVLEYLKNHAKDASMYQRNGGLRLKIEKVEAVLQALAIFEDIAGMTADQAAELTSAKSAPAPQAAPSEGN